MFLSDLLQRALGETGGIAPRRASRFEPESEAAGPTVMERSPERAPRRETIPAVSRPERHTETIVRETVEHRREALLPAPSVTPAAPAPVPVESAIEAATAIGGASPPRPPESRTQRREASATAPPPPTPQVARPAPAEAPHTETILREAVETRSENRTIERRLESLFREVERTHELHTEVIRTVPGTPTAAPPPTPVPSPAIVPVETRRSAPAQPVLLETSTAAPAAPVVHVTIGRVEVRAAAPAGAQPKARPREPRLSLDDYLQKREGA